MRKVLVALLLGLAVAVVMAVGGAWPAVASDEFPTPSCGDVGAGGVPSSCDDTDSGMGGFVALFVLVVVAGLGLTVYKVSMARDMARKSGMDPDQATAMTLLTDDGLAATYLASNLRPSAASEVVAPPVDAGRSVSQRLAELESLREHELVTQAEYDERRAAILGSL
jgi:hypothetical protein